jgi:hypothetical protein
MNAAPSLENKALFEDSTPLLGSPDLLRLRAEEDGFLYFRGMLPKGLVMELRRQVMEILDGFGWLDRRHPLIEGVANHAAVADLDGWCGAGLPREGYLAMQKLELFHALPHHPALIGLFSELLDGEVMVHPRNIGRVMLPSKAYHPTPAHQDFIHIQGAPATWTCWVPVGDCTRARGGLTVLRGSHREGVCQVARAEGAGGLETILCGKDYTWVEGDFQAGDIVTFSSHTVHKALPAIDRDHVRVSCDFRYQRADAIIEERSLRTHCDIAPWEEIYAGWPDNRLKYYWKDKSLKLSPWDPSLQWQKEKIC